MTSLKIPPFDRKFKSSYYSSGFRINTSLWANVSNEYQLENPQKSVFWTKPLVFVGSPTLKIPPFDREFNSAYYSSRFTINTSFWANVSSEYQLENPQNSVFWTKPSVFVWWPTLKIPLLDREFNSAYYPSGFRINTSLWANVSSEYQLENPKSSVFWTKPLVFVWWPTLKISPFDGEFNSAYYSSRFRINTSLWANVSSEYQLENPKKSVFWTKPLVFVGSPTLKIPLLDGEFNSAYYSSDFRVNTSLLANVTNE